MSCVIKRSFSEQMQPHGTPLRIETEDIAAFLLVIYSNQSKFQVALVQSYIIPLSFLVFPLVFFN